MFKKITTILGLALMLTVAGVTAQQVIQKNYTVAHASEATCNAGQDLSAKISADNKSVTITNKSKDCSYEVGYASYEVYNWDNEKFLNTQKLFDHVEKTIKANSSITLNVDLPTCSYQVDAFYGKVITKFSDTNTYANRKLDADNNLKKGLCTVKPTPTPTPTQTPETPVVTVSTTCVANNSTITISWNKANRDAKGYHVNITSNNNFDNGGWSKEISKDVTTFTTSDFSGMYPFGSAPGNLTMKSDATYKVRIYYVETNSHSEVKTISTQNCKPATTPTPTPTTFNGVCVADKSNVGSGSTITFTANATGGNGSYTYSWSGTDNLSGTSQSVSHIYWTSGDKTARVVITSGNKSVTADCSTSIWTGGTYNPPAFSAVCVPGTQTATIGQTVKYTANATGGNGSYAYSWSGTDGVSSNVQNLITSYSTVGQKTATVTVYSNGQSVTANCSTVVTAPVTTGGIYLSQVPYTGIGSNVRVFAFIIALIGWSAVIGYVLIKRQASKNGMSVAEYFNGQRSPVLSTAGFQAPVVASTMAAARPAFTSTPVAESYPSYASIAETKTPAQTIVDLLTRGEDQEVIVFIQNLQIQGQLVSDVLTNVALELDNVIKARTGVEANVDARISNSVATWSNNEIAYSIGAIVNALNQTSTSVYTASKIALIKIAEVAKVKNLA